MAGLNEPPEPTRMWDKDGFEIPPGYLRGPKPFDDVRAYQDSPGFREFIEAAREVLTREAFEDIIREEDGYEPCDCGQVHSTAEPLKFTAFRPDGMTDEARRKMDETLRRGRTADPSGFFVRPVTLDDVDGTDITYGRLRAYYRARASTVPPDGPIWTTGA